MIWYREFFHARGGGKGGGRGVNGRGFRDEVDGDDLSRKWWDGCEEVVLEGGEDCCLLVWWGGEGVKVVTNREEGCRRMSRVLVDGWMPRVQCHSLWSIVGRGLKADW